MILITEVEILLPTERGPTTARIANPLPPWLNPEAHSPLLKDNSLSIGLRNQRLLVQVQVVAMHPTALIMTSSLIVIFALLVYPLATTFSPHPLKVTWATSHVKTAVKTAFLISLAPLFIYLNEGAETIITN